jgi:hypothetical protein
MVARRYLTCAENLHRPSPRASAAPKLIHPAGPKLIHRGDVT